MNEAWKHYCWKKKANHKGLCTVWFHLWKMSCIGKTTETGHSWSPGDWLGKGRMGIDYCCWGFFFRWWNVELIVMKIALCEYSLVNMLKIHLIVHFNKLKFMVCKLRLDEADIKENTYFLILYQVLYIDKVSKVSKIFWLKLTSNLISHLSSSYFLL